jgi:hypothetical protein
MISLALLPRFLETLGDYFGTTNVGGIYGLVFTAWDAPAHSARC